MYALLLVMAHVVPSEPRELTASIPRGTSQILLTWLAPSNPNGELIGYLIVYKGITREEVQLLSARNCDVGMKFCDVVLQGLVLVDPVGVSIRPSGELEYVLTDIVPDLIYDFNVSIKHELSF